MTTRWLKFGAIAIETVALCFTIAGCASQKSPKAKSDHDVSIGVSRSANELPTDSINPANHVEVPPFLETSEYSQSVDVRRGSNLEQITTSAKATRLPPTSAFRSIQQVEFLPSETKSARATNAVHQKEAELAEELPALEPAGKVAEANQRLVPIDLSTALLIAAGDNPGVALARQRINEAYAQSLAANAMWVPSLRAGMNWNKHEGTIQDVEGNLIETSRGAVYGGFGAYAVGAGSPAIPGLVIDMRLRDAIFSPRIADRVLAASRQSSRATTNDILLDTAAAYNDLMSAMAIEAVAQSTFDNSTCLTTLTRDFAKSGQGLLSDADRALAEQSLSEIELRRSKERVQTASVRLARLLSGDPTLQFLPQEAVLVPIDIAPANQRVNELVAIGLTSRPELAESRQLVSAAVERLRSERSAPYIPSVLLGLSYGGFGAGMGDTIEGFADRLDFDAVAYWEIRNLGLGERAAREEASSRLQQARWRQVRVMDQVASEVAEAHIRVVSRREEIAIAQRGISSAQESHRRNLERIQDALGLPIEALQSIQALDRAQRQYVRSVADYNLAQFQLQRAIGWSIGTADGGAQAICAP